MYHENMRRSQLLQVIDKFRYQFNKVYYKCLGLWKVSFVLQHLRNCHTHT